MVFACQTSRRNIIAFTHDIGSRSRFVQKRCWFLESKLPAYIFLRKTNLFENRPKIHLRKEDPVNNLSLYPISFLDIENGSMRIMRSLWLVDLKCSPHATRENFFGKRNEKKSFRHFFCTWGKIQRPLCTWGKIPRKAINFPKTISSPYARRN